MKKVKYFCDICGKKLEENEGDMYVIDIQVEIESYCATITSVDRTIRVDYCEKHRIRDTGRVGYIAGLVEEAIIKRLHQAE